jgi:hypothetical protein
MIDSKPAIRQAAYTWHPLHPSMLTLLQDMDGAMHRADVPVQYARKAFLARVETIKSRMLELHAKGLSVPKIAVELGLTYSSAYEALQECKRQAGIK